MPEEQHSWDSFSPREAEFDNVVLRRLADTAWARPLLAEIERNGGLTKANKTRFFELRFGYALQQAGITPRYEVPGEGRSTLDFGFASGAQNWLVELMHLEETQAVKDATRTHVDEDGVQWFSLNLSTKAESDALKDRTQSIEGETLKAVERICQKCEREGQPHKFPVPDGACHVILADFRTFANGGDKHDRVHVGLGGEYVQEGHRMWWEGNLVSGVFNERTPVLGAREARERVHFLGFVHETKFADGGFAAGTQFIANPYLFATAADMQAVIADWPLQPVVVLNGN